MALTLLMATIAIQAGQATPPPKAAPPPPPIPDVLLARADESVEAEKALNEGKLDPTKLLVLESRNPFVACYGRLADETRARMAWTRTLADLIQNADQPYWVKGHEEQVRTLAEKSPFREAIRSYARQGVPMTMQLECTTTVQFSSSTLR